MRRGGLGSQVSVAKLSSVLGSQPQVNRVIIIVDTNNIPRLQSEILKLDFGTATCFFFLLMAAPPPAAEAFAILVNC